MQIINVHDAKRRFSKLMNAVSHGKEIVITKAGKPVAKLIPIKPAKVKCRFGVLKGKLKIPADFDGSLPDDVLDDFEG